MKLFNLLVDRSSGPLRPLPPPLESGVKGTWPCCRVLVAHGVSASRAILVRLLWLQQQYASNRQLLKQNPQACKVTRTSTAKSTK